MNTFLKILILVIILISIYCLSQNYNCSCNKKTHEKFSSIGPHILNKRTLDKLKLAAVVSTYEVSSKCNPGYYEPQNPWK